MGRGSMLANLVLVCEDGLLSVVALSFRQSWLKLNAHTCTVLFPQASGPLSLPGTRFQYSLSAISHQLSLAGSGETQKTLLLQIII